MEFIPDDVGEDFVVPFFEDANNSLGVVGYTTDRSEKQLRVEIERCMGHLGASMTILQPGKFGARYGYRMEFKWQGVPGRIDIAALPIRNETDSRIRQSKRHALYSLWKRLEAQFNSQLVMPGDFPLMPYMLDDKGRTILEYLQSAGKLPALPKPAKDSPIEGDFREVE